MDPRGVPLTASHTAGADENGWPDDGGWLLSSPRDGLRLNRLSGKLVWSASDIPFAEHYPKPKAMTPENIVEVKQAFVDAIKRCKIIGFDFIEIHGAHGYLLHNFYSSVSNKRTDEYGGSFENRIRLFLEIVELARKEWGDDKPLFARISASDWAEKELGPERAADGTWKWWGIEQSKMLVGELISRGVDLVDVSSGGNWVQQKIPVGPSYQVNTYSCTLREVHCLILYFRCHSRRRSRQLTQTSCLAPLGSSLMPNKLKVSSKMERLMSSSWHESC